MSRGITGCEDSRRPYCGYEVGRDWREMVLLAAYDHERNGLVRDARADALAAAGLPAVRFVLPPMKAGQVVRVVARGRIGDAAGVDDRYDLRKAMQWDRR